MSQHEVFRHAEAVAKVNGFAMRALAELAYEVTGRDGSAQMKPTRRENETTGPSDLRLLDLMVKALCSPDRRRFEKVVEAAVKLGHAPRDIANQYVPAIARKLGEDWVDDKLDFASVSIACARLQSYLRHTGLDWFEKASLVAPVKARALLIVPEFEQHTLGATLLAGQMRAQGICTTAELNTPVDQVAEIVAEQDFDAIMIASSQSETLEHLAAVVSIVRENCADALIMVGGNILEQAKDVLTITGADCTANSWQEALAVLEPKTNKKKPGLPAVKDNP